MFVVMGATGNVGRAVADLLLERGEEVTVLTRRPGDAVTWRDKGERRVGGCRGRVLVAPGVPEG